MLNLTCYVTEQFVAYAIPERRNDATNDVFNVVHDSFTLLAFSLLVVSTNREHANESAFCFTRD